MKKTIQTKPERWEAQRSSPPPADSAWGQDQGPSGNEGREKKSVGASGRSSKNRAGGATATPTKKKNSARAESNRRNSLKSTGPKSIHGKQRVRFNALTHGMTAESTILPDEDAAEFAARLKRLNDDLRRAMRSRRS